MSFVRTVLGDIAPGELGLCHAHEHVIIDPSYMREKFPEFAISDVTKAAEELSRFYAAGGRAMIDSMPTGGRNAAKLAEVSRLSGVHIVCPTGLHLQKYYHEGHWGGRLATDELSRLFIDEIELGIDANDLSGPALERLPSKAGLIKIASSLNGLTSYERRVFEAAAAAHRATGCPILTHTEQGTAALDQVECLRDDGVDLGHVCLSHTDRQPDAGYHREILSSGVRVEFDSAFRWKGRADNPTLSLIVSLWPDFSGQIMLGMDAAKAAYWKVYGGAPGMNYLIEDFAVQLRREGFRQQDLDRIFVHTPADTFRFGVV